MQKKMTATTFLVLPVLLCGVFGYPTTTSDQNAGLVRLKLGGGKPSFGGKRTRECIHSMEKTTKEVEEVVIKENREVGVETLGEGLPPRTFYIEETLHRVSGTQRRDAGQISSHPDITQVVTSRPGYSSEYNVRQDPPPSEDDLQRNRRKREAEADASAEDDSDMYLEPDKVEIKKIPQTTTAQPATEAPVRTKDNQQMGQHFFPSFAPVFSLGHSRPHQLFHQEPFYTSKSRSPPSLGPDFNPFRAYRDSSYKIPITIEDDAISTNILGSGNFGVLRGGTFYNEDDEYGGLFSPHYSNNGHGRPYYSNPRPQKYSNGDFFSNFRDFADINTPTKASYSEYVVVYVNKNATKDDKPEAVAPGEISRPKNIFEQLTLLDQDDALTNSEETTNEKKQSLHKRKLALLKQEKLNKQKKSYYKHKETAKDFLEPLIALS